jgi:hypothetical protein
MLSLPDTVLATRRRVSSYESQQKARKNAWMQAKRWSSLQPRRTERAARDFAGVRATVTGVNPFALSNTR